MNDNQFEVVFLMDDNETVLDKQSCGFGDSVNYKGKLPEKEPTVDGKYIFEGWTNEEELGNITSNVTCVAKFRYETTINIENVMYQLTENVAENANLNDSLEAGKKVAEQQKALELDKRSVEKIIAEVKENGRAEIGDVVQDKDMEK